MNYPGSTSAIRNPEFRKVVHTMQPDVLVIQEMISAAGLSEFLGQVMNAYTPSLFAAAPFNNGPDTDNGLYYRPDKWEYLGATYIPTALRDIAEYALRPLNSIDTFRVYSLHLKASSGPTNESLRLAEATILRNHLNSLPAGSKFVVAGDFNIYRSTEPAFQKLIGSETNNNGRVVDPLNLIGVWQDNPAFAIHHTQSPRVRSFGGGATGGLDDRFDMILPSTAMHPRVITSTYTAYGNDGNHLNDSINRLPNTAVPDSVANALHNASDHLPVFVRVVFERNLYSAPVALTAAATSITGTSAQLNGTINPNNASTTVRFAWGETPTLTDTTAGQSIGSGGTSVPVSALLSGLSQDETYYYRVIASNTAGTATGSILSFTTLPPPPGTPALLSPADGDTLAVFSLLCEWTSVPGAAFYRFQLANDSLFASILVDDSSLATTNITIHSLIPGLEYYYWRASARNAGGDGGFSSFRRFSTPSQSSVSLGLIDGWNIVSLPMKVGNASTSIVFPTAVSAAYAFSGTTGYASRDTLEPGTGYWLKFGASQSVNIAGYAITSDTINAAAGWNLIGAISTPVPITSIVTIPTGIIDSDFFTWSTGYAVADSLHPGKAYWVKISSAGKIVLQSDP